MHNGEDISDIAVAGTDKLINLRLLPKRKGLRFIQHRPFFIYCRNTISNKNQQLYSTKSNNNSNYSWPESLRILANCFPRNHQKRKCFSKLTSYFTVTA